jgi:DNA-binding XRE family transcriptional regulator
MRERIKEIIEREGMGQSQFADFIGVNRPTLSHILAGRNNPSMEVVMKIHQKFPQINILWLLDGMGSYEGDAVADYAGGALIEDRVAEADNVVPYERTDQAQPSLSAVPGGQPQSRFYQGELFAENAVFASESTGAAKNRKEMPLQTPQNTIHRTEIQAQPTQKIVHRKIAEIKIFYDDGTYETFKQ